MRGELPEYGRAPDVPPPLGGSGPWPAPDAGPAACPDPEWESYLAWREREIAAGRDEEPPAPWETEGPAVSISLGDAADVDPALLAAICGPDGLGGPLGAQFAQGKPADALRPGPVLAALTEQAAGDLSALTDDQLFGALHAASRLENRLYYLKTLAIAEFGRRRAAQRADADARGIRPGRRPGERPDAELAAELLISRNLAGDRLAAAAQLTSRLPRTLAGMADGLIDPCRADTIAFYTASLSRQDMAEADQVLAGLAPQVRAEALARRAAALEMKLDPEAAKARKEHARKGERVEVKRELSGNASVAGRELALAEALASKANIHGLALRLRGAGLPGTLDSLRVMVFNDLLQSRNPLDRIAPPLGEAAGAADVPPPAAPDDEDLDYAGAGEAAGEAEDAPAPACRPDPAPMPAVINLVVHAGTLLGWDTIPSEAGGWGLLDPGDTSAIVRAASAHPQTRWCMTVTGDDGTAIAHGCSAGQHPWDPGGPSDCGPPSGPPGGSPRGPSGGPPDRPPGKVPGPDARQAARLAELLRRLDIRPEPIAAGNCDHASAEDRYAPGRKLRHLVRARTATCTGPGCRAQAIYADLDHTTPWPHGPTCQCNLGPKCRTHHRCKETPGWKLEQPQPGVFRWTLPNGRVHVTRPTSYD